jgi:hypothetical protein
VFLVVQVVAVQQQSLQALLLSVLAVTLAEVFANQQLCVVLSA